MDTGNCLCEKVSWEISGKSCATFHCHCSMCRKAHGAAFGTYAYMPAEEFYWTGDQSTVSDYCSSPLLSRSFCSRCGSTVPSYDRNDTHVFVPIGCQDEGPAVDGHIFVGSKAPWFDICDDLPQNINFPSDDDSPVYPDRPPAPGETGVIRGSCLCGEVKFKVTAPFRTIQNCHCQRCRRGRAAAFATNGFTTDKDLVFTCGTELLKSHQVPDAKFFTQVFCRVCGSIMPWIDSPRKFAGIPLGVLDDNPGQKPQRNIYTAFKANWYPLHGNLPSFNEKPHRSP